MVNYTSFIIGLRYKTWGYYNNFDSMRSLGVCYWCVKIPQCGYMEHGIKDIAFYVQKHITPCTVCHNFSLVCDKPLVVPASVKRVYSHTNRQALAFFWGGWGGGGCEGGGGCGCGGWVWGVGWGVGWGGWGGGVGFQLRMKIRRIFEQADPTCIACQTKRYEPHERMRGENCWGLCWLWRLANVPPCCEGTVGEEGQLDGFWDCASCIPDGPAI